MFGLWRMVLALEVVAFHLLLLPLIGAFAVFSFFVLSGFLMTAIMHRSYGYDAAGVGRYLANRALRLYPAYWLAAALSLLLLALAGAPEVARYHAAIAYPASSSAWAANLTMLFPAIVPRDVMPRLVPLAWALTVEILFYAVIALGASRTMRRTLVWLLLSILYALFATTLHHPRDAGESIPIYQYSALPAGSLPFAAGALIWHLRDRAAVIASRVAATPLLIAARWMLWLVISLAQSGGGAGWMVIAGLWGNVLLSALIVASLADRRAGPRLRAADKLCGDYSYPIYLLHLQMGIVAAMLMFGTPVAGRSPQGVAVLAVAFVLTLALATLVVRLLDPAVERLRNRVRPGLPAAAGGAPAVA